MPIDSASKRRAALDYEEPWAEAIPLPDGSIEKADRYSMLWNYPIWVNYYPGCATVLTWLYHTATVLTSLVHTATVKTATCALDQAVVTPNWYLFRDLFSTAVGAGLLNGTAATPGSGLRVVTDAESKSSIVASEARLTLAGQATPVWGDQVMKWSDIARVTGRCLVGVLDIGDQDNVIAFGLANGAVTGDPANVGHGFIGDGKKIGFISDLASADQFLEGTKGLRPLEHLVIVACNDIGAIVLVSTIGDTSGLGESEAAVLSKYPDARLIWVDYQDTTSSLTPFISSASASSYGPGNYLRDLRIVDVDTWASADYLAAFSDRFARADSSTALGNDWTAHSGVWGISSGQAYQVSGAGRALASHATTLTDGNAIWHWRVKMKSGGLEVHLRVIDVDNFIFLSFTGTAIYLHKVVGGAYAVISSTALVMADGTYYDIDVIASGNKYRVFVDGDDPFGDTWLTDSGSSLLNETRIGIAVGADISGELFDSVACWPLEVALPAILQVGAVPQILAGDATLGSDTFTDSNGVRLSAHTAEAGTWTEHSGTWTVQTNKASLSGTGNCFVTQDLGVTDIESQVVITTPGTGTTFYAGITARYVNDSNLFYARIFMNPTQPGSDEIEFTRFVSGISGVVRKLNLGDYFATSTDYTLKVQCKDDFIYVWLDGQPICSYQTVSTDPAGTRFGLYRDGTNDAGCVFDDWSVKTL